jgi:aspartate racemase
MKTIGLIGGMSWESTAVYYRLINEGIKARLGGLHSARCVLYSVDFGEIEADRHAGGFPAITPALVGAARAVEAAGADFVVLCTNTMHRLAGEIQANLQVPFLHIADATADAIRARGIKKIGLLGTRFTMEEDFYVGRLTRQHGLEVLIPSAPERECVHRVIYDELCLGDLRPDSRAAYRQIIERLAGQGAEGIILGCTEIGLLVKPADSPVPLFDTTELHAQAAVAYALTET